MSYYNPKRKLKRKEYGPFFLVLLALAIFIVPVDVLARGRGHSGWSTFRYSSAHSGTRSSYSLTGRISGGHKSRSTSHVGSHRARVSSTHGSKKAVGVKRSKDGKIARNHEAKEKFMRQTGYPEGRPGYVVDHIIPLKRGGKDDPTNMQWQTKGSAKAKDKWE